MFNFTAAILAFLRDQLDFSLFLPGINILLSEWHTPLAKAIK
jgi:hypothetical protein